MPPSQRDMELAGGPSAREGPSPTRHQFCSASEWHAVCGHFALSNRESLVARHLVEGATERVVADELGLSVHTVHTYAWRIYRKVGAQDRQALTLRFVDRLRSLTLRDVKEQS
jgi:DNA-binding NarL/FixJ family response regulator